MVDAPLHRHPRRGNAGLLRSVRQSLMQIMPRQLEAGTPEMLLFEMCVRGLAEQDAFGTDLEFDHSSIETPGALEWLEREIGRMVDHLQV